MNQKTIPNIIVFGSTGVGKSSVVNMLEGSNKATVSGTARGVTFSNTCYRKTVNGLPFNVYDTAGLNEGTAGTVSPREAIEGLYNLTRRLTGGISLLVFVMRGGITAITKQNYHLFSNVICDRQVPIVIVITGLENERNMDGWWDANKHAFDKNEMYFNGYACITATEGLSRSFQHEYRQSRTKVEKSIYCSYRRTPWNVSQKSWFTTALIRSHGLWAESSCSRDLIPHELKATPASYGEVVGAPNVIVFGGDCIRRISGMLDSLDQPNDEPQISQNLNTYGKSINGSAFRIHEIVTSMTITRNELEIQYRRIRRFKDSVNLLMFVVEAGKAPPLHYGKIFETLFHKRVPVVLVVVGMSSKQHWDAWWPSHKRIFDQHEMNFSGKICITTTDRNAGQAFKDSKQRIESLICDTYDRVPWKASPNPGFGALIRSYSGWPRITGLKSHILAPELCSTLMAYCGLSEKEAGIVSNRIARNV